ncbi:hypothetical protein DFO67_11735 [Modicisalibacter xianhensis]|uniref:Uncharacterized protein n=1 Tax=Modicisalibacter xianhensis TaxID=442341 RepID=A0A4R8FU74_9GAMM|nr:hypothetical protein DFO67_11735 [Halomonas xianhensis]
MGADRRTMSAAGESRVILKEEATAVWWAFTRPDVVPDLLLQAGHDSVNGVPKTNLSERKRRFCRYFKALISRVAL